MVEAANCDSAYIYCPGGPRSFHARMFSPTAGIPEDPATGSASAILSAQLLACGELKEGMNSFRLEQGHDMGRPSDIALEIDVAGGNLAEVRVAGSSVAVSEGLIEI